MKRYLLAILILVILMIWVMMRPIPTGPTTFTVPAKMYLEERTPVWLLNEA